tara:strand:+ start:804 stop:1688 length:885 start_codon:yes stop_codon:yes gene_type:complete
MKYLQLLFILILIPACSGTKPVVERPQKEIAQTQKATDSIIEVIKTSEDESMDPISEVEKNTLKEDSKIFNQTLTKRFIPTHQLWNELLEKHVSENGNVNYKSFKTDHKKLLDYIYVLNLAKSNDAFQSFSKEEKLAYWINAYNAFTIDLMLRNYPIKSIKDIKNPWDQRLWKLGEKWYNLNDIEHQILRKMDEPRIHFAIVCASYSCPELQNEAYQASNLDAQLTKATKEFLHDSDRNNISENNLELSKIFQWFAKDFKQNGSLIDFLNQYSDIKISEKAKKSFKDYNWDLNE